jgi:histidinol-phosphate phosphatase family protein
MASTRAVFLDRDGVLNKKRDDYVKSVKELEILPEAGKKLSLLMQKGFKLIIVTNQSAVNRKIISKKELDEINSFLLKELEKSGCKIDAVYVCPHRPDEFCNCRKPKPGLLQQAAKDFGIDLRNSWIIGDCDSDIEAGISSGCRGARIETNSDLSSAVELILSSWEEI